MTCTQRRISFSTSFLFLVAIAACLIPIQWVGAWLLSSFAHELGHLLVIIHYKITPWELRFGASGPRIRAAFRYQSEQVFCAAAGPLANLFILLFARWIPRIAVCAMIQAVCNLLPAYPLDGGRIFAGLINMMFKENIGQKIIQFIGNLCVVFIGIVVIYFSIRYTLGYLPLIGYLLFTASRLRIKLSCKPGAKGVQ